MVSTDSGSEKRSDRLAIPHQPLRARRHGKIDQKPAERDGAHQRGKKQRLVRHRQNVAPDRMIYAGKKCRADRQQQVPACESPASCRSGFHEIKTIPTTTNNVPRMISKVVGSPRIMIAMAALIQRAYGLQRAAARSADFFDAGVGEQTHAQLKNSDEREKQNAGERHGMNAAGYEYRRPEKQVLHEDRHQSDGGGRRITHAGTRRNQRGGVENGT